MSRLPSKKEAEELLWKVKCPPQVIRHSKVVAKLAVQIANKIQYNGVAVNVKLVEIGALLHDIGRSQTHTVLHSLRGGEIARSLHLTPQLVNIIERHIGAGISSEEAVKSGMPNRSFMPETLEEKIVAYADKFVIRDRIVSFDEALKDFAVKLKSPQAVKRLKKMHSEFLNLLGS